ncbi:MAG TPA: winged helix-turn-helix domain-containing protein [Candidatus Sulfotelmatobacter sp.]|nr:winged helix-turn-helix domain-containing protein [Candidatus Sulfotelmatobacter sp.]
MVPNGNTGGELPNAGSIRFGEFEYDPRNGELRKQGIRVRLQNQPLAILLALTASPGTIVSREELRARIWGSQTFVEFEQGLNSAIKRLRDTLADSAEQPRYIETVAGKGYRFVCPVEVVNSASETSVTSSAIAPSVPLTDEASSPPAKLGPRRRVFWTAFACVALISISIATYVVWRRAAAPIRLSASQLTFNTQELPVIGAAISPDGRYLAYSDANGVFARDLHSSLVSERRLTLDDSAITSLSWTPDGTSILAVGARAVWAIDFLSNQTREVLEGGIFARSSPTSPIAAINCAPHTMCIVDLASGAKLHEFKEDDRQAVWSRAAWSPDGQWLAFIRHAVSDRGVTASIVVSSLDGNSRTQVFEGAPLGGNLLWTSKGIFFDRPRKPPEARFSDLWLLPLDRHNRPAAPAYRVTNWPEFNFFNLGQTADSKQFAFFRAVTRQQVYVARLAKNDEALIDLKPLGSSAQDNSPTGWADNDTVLLESSPNVAIQVAEQRLDANGPTVPWYSAPETLGAVRTSDGKAVIYYTSESIAMRADQAGTRQPLFKFQGLVRFRCPIKTKVCFARLTTTSGQRLVRRLAKFEPYVPESLQYLPIENSQFNWWDPDPSGRRIAVSNSDASAIEIYDLDGKKLTAIHLNTKDRFETASWTQDGLGLLAAFTVGGGGRVEFVTEHSEKVIWSSAGLRLWAPVMSPDGVHVAFRGNFSESNVWLAQFEK